MLTACEPQVGGAVGKLFSCSGDSAREIVILGYTAAGVYTCVCVSTHMCVHAVIVLGTQCHRSLPEGFFFIYFSF